MQTSWVELERKAKCAGGQAALAETARELAQLCEVGDMASEFQADISNAVLPADFKAQVEAQIVAVGGGNDKVNQVWP